MKLNVFSWVWPDISKSVFTIGSYRLPNVPKDVESNVECKIETLKT